MRIAVVVLSASLALANPVKAATFQFCWIGGAGYTMHGTISFPDTRLGTGIITESDLTGFTIRGFHDGVPVGFWSLDMLKPETTWILGFDTDTLSFPMGGIRAENSYQAWNANGRVDDCGAGGFGFNGGNAGQDVCIDNTYIEVSTIDRFTPLQAMPMDRALVCEDAIQMM